MGTPDFAVASLDAICKAGFQVVGVITAPDRPAGRGMKLTESAVKKYATEHGLTILQPVKLKDSGFSTFASCFGSRLTDRSGLPHAAGDCLEYAPYGYGKSAWIIVASISGGSTYKLGNH